MNSSESVETGEPCVCCTCEPGKCTQTLCALYSVLRMRSMQVQHRNCIFVHTTWSGAPGAEGGGGGDCSTVCRVIQCISR